MNSAPLQALQDLQPPVLFAGLPAILGHFMWIFWTFGFLLIVGGHIFRLKEASNDMQGAVNTWYKTILILVCMILSPQFLQWGVEGVQDIQTSSGVGSPVAVTRKAIRLAFTFPELESVFSTFARNQQSPPTAGPDPVRDAVNQGGIWGYTKAFFIAMGQEASDVATNSKRAFNAMIDGPALIAALITAGIKAIAIVLAGGLLYLFMIGAGIIVWFIDTLRYFLLVTGALLLPTFIAGYNTKWFSSQAHNYVTWMLSVVFWPFGWMLGNIGTVGLFNAYVSLISGTSLVAGGARSASNFVNNFSWDNIDSTVSGGSTALLWGGGALAMGASIPFLYLLLVALGALFLFLWILMVHIGGPIFITKLVTMGASFYGQAAGATLKTGAAVLGGGMKLAGQNKASSRSAMGASAGAGSGAAGGAVGGGLAAVAAVPLAVGEMASSLADAGAAAATSGGSSGSAQGSESRPRAGGGGASSSGGGSAGSAAGGKNSKGGLAGMAGAVKAAAARAQGVNKGALGMAMGGSVLDALSKMGDDPSLLGSASVGGASDYLHKSASEGQAEDEKATAQERMEMTREQTALLRKIASSLPLTKAGKN